MNDETLKECADKISKEDRETVFAGKTIKENMRDIIARNNTGYSYAELEEAIKRDEDLLGYDELEGVDKTVNILAHLFQYYQEQL